MLQLEGVNGVEVDIVNYRNRAEKELIKFDQNLEFPTEIKSLREGKVISGKSSIIKANPTLDEEGMLRSNSRLITTPWLSWEFKYPIILSSKSAVTKMIVEDNHIRLKHTAGINYQIAELSRKYWFPKMRKTVKSYQNYCKTCQREKAKGINMKMAPIPEFRLKEPLRA